MATETVDRPLTGDAGACAIDAAHLAHEIGVFKAKAADAAESGVYAAKRALTRGYRDIEDLQDSVAHRIRRAPLLAVGAAFAAGVLLGVVSRQCARGARRGAAS